MDRNELISMLGIKPKEPSLSQSKKLASYASTPTPLTQISPHALELDQFDKAQGGKLLRHNHHLRETNLEPEVVSDFFSLNFLTNPQIVEQCKDERRLEFVQKTMDSPDYLALHRSTELNPVASELACVELSQAFKKLRDEDKQQQEKNEQKKKQGKRVNPEREAMKSDLACMRAVGKALKKANQEVEDYEETMTALGCGPGQGGNEKLDVGKLAQTFQKTKDSPVLRRIMELAGRYRRAAQAKQRQKVIHGMDDMVGCVLDGDVGRLLPTN